MEDSVFLILKTTLILEQKMITICYIVGFTVYVEVIHVIEHPEGQRRQKGAPLCHGRGGTADS